MVLVAVPAIDLAVLGALRRVPNQTTQTGIFGVLPMADILVVFLAIVVNSLARRGEVALSGVVFLLFGGTAVLLLVAIALKLLKCSSRAAP
jgi:Kef-type K+ transport system membrane component KefB